MAKTLKTMTMIPKMAITVRRTFDCSTCHITKHDRDKLEAAEVAYLPQIPVIVMLADIARVKARTADPLIVYGYYEGWIVHVPTNDKAFEDYRAAAISSGYSDVFVMLLRIAKAKKCVAIWFDADAEKYAKLPQFDW